VRRIPYLLLGALVVLTGAFAVLSIVQSNSSGASDHILAICNDEFDVKPSTYVMSCGGVNSTFTDLHWYGWGDATAYATGEAHSNNCQPTCAAGRGRSHAVTIWVWDLRTEHHFTAYTKLQTTSGDLSVFMTWGSNGGGFLAPGPPS
jgi:hypothetical protein